LPHGQIPNQTRQTPLPRTPDSPFEEATQELECAPEAQVSASVMSRCLHQRG
jgi:hypothetical protein